MARTATKQEPQTTAVVNWQDEMEREAQIAQKTQAGIGGGQFFSLQSSILSLNGTEIPNNEMAVVVVDNILENVYYEGAYDPDNPSPPLCFAFGREAAGMAPHATVFEHGTAQNAKCGKERQPGCCPHNEFGTADRGKGKACRNTQRLAVIFAGELDGRGKFTAEEDAEHFASTAVSYLKLPVTSTQGWANYVNQVAGVQKRPPHAVFTKIKVVLDKKTQHRVLFEYLGTAPDELWPILKQRNTEVKAVIEQPYNLDVEPVAEPVKTAKKAAAPVRRGAKY
jgi:hypothetical protein